MGKDRSKKTAIKWGTNFYLDKSGRGYVTAGVRGTPIRVTVEMDPATKARSQATENYNRTCQSDSIWAMEMERIAKSATTLARHEWDVWRDQNTKQ